MLKSSHEIRDPVHGFVRVSSEERQVLDSRPFQRLRYIHQLALTYLVYPGATHRRFEHSLGVMELASRIFDVLTQEQNLREGIRQRWQALQDIAQRGYWRQVVRMAALCHDIGHLPFSHAAEAELLPEGWDHERLTVELIRSAEMEALWRRMTPPIRSEDVAKLAVGFKKAQKLGLELSEWESVLSEIIVSDVFGADRMDYLLRDSYHAGVAYGRFDHHRLIDTLRLLEPPIDGSTLSPPTIGVEYGGLHSAEALLLARYSMYAQVYFHPVRRIYDIHLKDFLRAWLPGQTFSTKIEDLLRMTDNEVTAAMFDSARAPESPGFEAARRITSRDHFRLLYQLHPADKAQNAKADSAIFAAAKEKFGEEYLRHDTYQQKGGIPSFPLVLHDDSIVWASLVSNTLQNIPLVAVGNIFVASSLKDEARKWLGKNRDQAIRIIEESL